MLTLRLERDLVEALHEIKIRDGVPLNEQIKRAIQLWLVEKADAPKSVRKKEK